MLLWRNRAGWDPDGFPRILGQRRGVGRQRLLQSYWRGQQPNAERHVLLRFHGAIQDVTDGSSKTLLTSEIILVTDTASQDDIRGATTTRAD